MKLTAVAVGILALGIVVGFALAGGASGGPASAVPQCPGPSSQCPAPTPAPPQQREDQIVLTTAFFGFVPGDWQMTTFNYAPVVGLDPSDYDAGSSFSFEAVLISTGPDLTGCARLYNLTTDLPVDGSEVCLIVGELPPSGIVKARLRSDSITLASGENDYTIQSKCPLLGCGIHWHGTRIIAEWTE